MDGKATHVRQARFRAPNGYGQLSIPDRDLGSDQQAIVGVSYDPVFPFEDLAIADLQGLAITGEGHADPRVIAAVNLRREVGDGAEDGEREAGGDAEGPTQ